MTPVERMTGGGDKMRDVGAIVLGGGRGSRLYPLTAVRSKPAVPVAGRYRLVDIPLSNCIHSGIQKVVVLTQFLSHSLHRHINNTYRFDAFSKGFVDLLAAEQTEKTGDDWFQGTADAVRKQLVHISDLKTEYYLILSGDQLYRMDYRTMLDTHIRKGADITVSALPVGRAAAQGFGIMRLHTSGRIRQFAEKPKDEKVLQALVTPQKLFDDAGLVSKGKPYLASMGVYLFKRKVLESLLESHPGWTDFGKEVLPNALKTHRVYAHLFNGFWEDIGTVRSYFDVHMALTSQRPPFEFHDPDHEIYTHLRALPGVRVRNTTIDNAIVCSGSRITNATIKDSIIGIRSIIHEGAQLERCIMLGADSFETSHPRRGTVPMGIGRDSRVHNAIIDHNARIGKGAVIRGGKRLRDQDGDGWVVRDGIVIVLKNAVIPDGTVIG